MHQSLPCIPLLLYSRHWQKSSWINLNCTSYVCSLYGKDPSFEQRAGFTTGNNSMWTLIIRIKVNKIWALVFSTFRHTIFAWCTYFGQGVFLHYRFGNCLTPYGQSHQCFIMSKYCVNLLGLQNGHTDINLFHSLIQCIKYISYSILIYSLLSKSGPPMYEKSPSLIALRWSKLKFLTTKLIII